jgi:hypothetical protein
MLHPSIVRHAVKLSTAYHQTELFYEHLEDDLLDDESLTLFCVAVLNQVCGTESATVDVIGKFAALLRFLSTFESLRRKGILVIHERPLLSELFGATTRGTKGLDALFERTIRVEMADEWV